jgi:hypothetical protein
MESQSILERLNAKYEGLLYFGNDSIASMRTKVQVKCLVNTEHKAFNMLVSSLFNNKSACKECSNYNKGVIRANKAIKECINNTNINLKNYDYSQIKSIKSKSDEVIIKCIKPDHNWLNITTTIKAHMRAKKGSCSLCNNRFNLENNREYFIEYLNRSNDYNFEYLNLDDVKNQDKDLLTMRCKKHNDEFKITIKRHKKYPSGGCKSCENELRGATRRYTYYFFK